MKTAAHQIDKECLQNALDSLSKNDRDTIQALTVNVEKEIKSRGPYKVMFGYWSALELLAKLGIFMDEKGFISHESD